MLKRTASFAAAIVTVAALAIAILPQKALAAAPVKPATCEQGVWNGLTNKNFGTDVPAILVHGASGNVGQWGKITEPNTLAGKIQNLPGVAVAHILDYTWWSPTSGTELAKTIDCVSEFSKANGGKGKVIVVGYSQGGLVTRYALDNHRTRPVPDQVGLVVTIGTPHGTATVPAFPSQTIVHNVAGNITNIYKNTQGQVVESARTDSDSLVSVADATLNYTNDDSNPRGGGMTIVHCEDFFTRKSYTIPWINYTYTWNEDVAGTPSCKHGELVSNANSGAHKATIDAIKEYMEWLSPSATNITINGAGTKLTTKYDSRWTKVEYGASGDGWDAFAEDTTNVADGNRAYIQLTNMNWCNRPTMLECMTSNVIGTAPSVTVGGRTPDTSAVYEESPEQHIIAYAWCFETEKICFNYRRSVQPPQLEVSQALRDVLSTAIWTDQ